MNTPQPDHQRLTGHRLDEDAAIHIFTVPLPRWRFVRLFGRNPLLLAGDRVEAQVLVLAIVVALVTASIAAAVGTAVYDSRRQLYAEQAKTRRTVAATVIDDSVAQVGLGKTMTVLARWFAAGAEHSGTVKTRQALKPGDSIDIWVNQDGSQAGPPMRTAVYDAVAAGLAIWLSVAIAAAALFAGTRAVLNRLRHGRYQPNFDNLLGDSDGQTSQS